MTYVTFLSTGPVQSASKSCSRQSAKISLSNSVLIVFTSGSDLYPPVVENTLLDYGNDILQTQLLALQADLLADAAWGFPRSRTLGNASTSTQSEPSSPFPSRKPQKEVSLLLRVSPASRRRKGIHQDLTSRRNKIEDRRRIEQLSEHTEDGKSSCARNWKWRSRLGKTNTKDYVSPMQTKLKKLKGSKTTSASSSSN